jgi:N-acetylmuramic acid 6-phosphate etherase
LRKSSNPASASGVSQRSDGNSGSGGVTATRKVAGNLNRLTTEKANRAAGDLDRKSALQIARIINSEDGKVALAVKRALPQIARAIDFIAASLSRGGRLIYVGAGTSGRVAALDAVECAPTFSTAPETVQFAIAGGPKALASAVEANEDSIQLGRREMAKRRLGKNDVVVGIAASGRTPFTIAAVDFARRRGATTIALTCNRNSPLEKIAGLAILTDVGPEVVSGSTRMKAGTAQKMVLNMLSTGAMIRLGFVYGNLMVNVHPTNEKLAERATTILKKAANVESRAARKALQQSGRSVPVALVMLKAKVDRNAAQEALKSAKGNVRHAIAIAKGHRG